MLYLRGEIPCKTFNEYDSEKPIKNVFVEINLRSRKWLLSYSYNPHTNLLPYRLHYIGREIEFYYSKYNNFIVVSDLNTEISNSFWNNFVHYTV